MGLTEGEGEKDVSDQIESQDQLEDAKKDYNDEPEQNKDLKVNWLLYRVSHENYTFTKQKLLEL